MKKSSTYRLDLTWADGETRVACGSGSNAASLLRDVARFLNSPTPPIKAVCLGIDGAVVWTFEVAQ